MRTSAVSFTKKFISTFFAATLALGLVPAAAFANDDVTATTESGQDTDASPSMQRGDSSSLYEDQATSDISHDEPVADAPSSATGEDGTQNDATVSDDSRAVLPAATERINRTMPLETVAQRESTRDYFLAQTLESTKTVPIVSASLPLDKGADRESQADADGGPATVGSEDKVADSDLPTIGAEREDSSEGESGEDSDEADLGGTDATEGSAGISAESTVLGSFIYRGITYAVEPGGESVAVMATDYAKQPEEFIRAQTIVLPSVVTLDDVDHYSVARIADDAFAGINAAAAVRIGQDDVAVESPEESSSTSDGLSDATVVGITIIDIPASVASIGDDAFAGFDTLQYLVVEDDNPEYASYDGALYSADLTQLRLIPEGRVGAVRVAPNATMVDSEVFSHCPSVDIVVADPASGLWQQLDSNELRNGSGGIIELIDPAESGDRAIPDAYEPDRDSIEDLRRTVLALDVVGSETSAPFEGTSSAEALLDERNVFLDQIDASQTLKGTPFALSCLYSLNTSGYTYYLKGSILDGSLKTERYVAGDGTSFEVIAITIEPGGFKPNEGYDYETVLSRLKKDNGDTVTSIVCQDCGFSLGQTQLRQLCDTGNQTTGTHTIRHKPGCLVTKSNGEITNESSNPDLGSDADVWIDSAHALLDAKGGVFPGDCLFWSLYGAKGGIWQGSPSSAPTRYGYTPERNDEGWVIYTAHNGSSVYRGSRVEANGFRTYYPNWIPNTYTVEYWNRAGTQRLGSATCTYDEAFDLAARPSSGLTAGYTASGWATSANQSAATSGYGFGASMSNLSATNGATVKLYLAEAPKQSALSFDLDGGSGGGTLTGKTATYGQAMPTTGMTVPAKEGYIFNGYRTAKNGGGTSYYGVNGSSIISARNWNIDTTATTTLYAHWVAKQSALSFDLDGGSGGGTLTGKTATYGQAMPTTGMTVPTKRGYTFGGYYTAKNGNGTQYYGVSGNSIVSARNWAVDRTAVTTLYARWTPIKYRVKYKTRSGAEIRTTNYIDYDQTFALDSVPAAQYLTTGYTAKGWAHSANQSTAASGRGFGASVSGLTDVNNGEVQLYLAEAPKQSALSFDLDGGSGGGTLTGKTATYGQAMPTTGMTLPAKLGYIFGGYYTAKNGGGTSYYGVNGSSIISARNWNIDTTATTTLYAKWTKKPLCTVALNANGGSPEKTVYYWPDKGYQTTSATSNTTVIGVGQTLIPEDALPDLVGHSFAGYYSAATGGTQYVGADGKLLPAAPVLSVDAIWYAHWVKGKYTITWNYDGGDSKGEEKQTNVEFGSRITMRDPGMKPGWKFDGWEASGSIKGTYAEGEVLDMGAGDVMFTATWSRGENCIVNLVDRWLEQPTRQVFYWPGNGYVPTAVSTTPVGIGNKLVSDPQLSMDPHYRFLGYFDVPEQTMNEEEHLMIDAAGILRTDKEITAAVTWYAHWERSSCQVDLLASYGDPAFAVKTPGTSSVPIVRFGSSFKDALPSGRITKPERTGYTFKGYWTKPNEEVSATDGTYEGECWIDEEGVLSEKVWNEVPIEKLAAFPLYAAWELDDCEVTFDVAVPNGTQEIAVPDQSVFAPRIWNYGKAYETLPAPPSAFQRTGYDFIGWYYLRGSDKVKTFVSDEYGNPKLRVWDDDAKSVVLYADWKAKAYTLEFYENHPQAEGLVPPPSEPRTVKVAYDERLDASPPAPFNAFRFAGWYVNSQSLEGTHMTDGRFTPQGSLLLQTSAPIPVLARWIEPGQASYALYVGAPSGTDLVRESVHEYRYTETIVLNASVAPDPVDGYSFAGWVKVGSDAEARALVAAGGPAADAVTTPGFGPFSNEDMFFVAKWTTRELSVTLSSVAFEDGTDRLLPTDRLVDHEAEGALPWSAACEGLGVSRPELARTLVYDVTQGRFALPEVMRKGHVFKGWVLQGATDAAPSLEVIVDPAEQAASPDSLALVYVPVFEDAVYTIVLDGNGLGVDEEPVELGFRDEFVFPYPSTLQTGSCFACWADVPDNASNATRTFFPESSVPVAPVYDEDGTVVEFGLAQLADENNVIRLYAVWNKGYNVEVPLGVSMALDTETGDVIAGSHVLTPWKDGSYRIESLRYEPVFDEAGNAAFAGATDVNLSVYAGLSLGDAVDERDLLRAANVGEAGALSYVDAGGVARTATPLLVGLGGTTPLLVAKPALDAVTEKGVNGFNDFGALDPLTVRYGLYFEDAATLERFAYKKGKAGWMLPENDGAGENGWSSESAPVARLRYTVSLL